MNKYEQVVQLDSNPTSPREWYNLGVMCLDCLTNYNLNEDTEYTPAYKCQSQQEYIEYMDKQPVIYIPIMAYIHGSISLYKGTNKQCKWDSGFAGCMYVKKEDIYKMYERKRISKKLKKQIIDKLSMELDILDSYLNGVVWEYCIYDKESKDVLETCGGYYDRDDAVNACTRAVNTLLSNDTKE